MYRKWLKRLIDILLSIIFLPLILVLLLICAILVKLDDRGPVFYCGERLGKDGRVFRMYKIRTMKVNSPDIRLSDGTTWNSENDFRVTRVGKYLRKTSLDEIPQIFNVLRGEMSLIGPRPDTVDFYERYSPEELERLSMLPGITGYCQAYYRNSINAKEKIKKDIFYVKNVSFLLDVKILFKTLVSIFKQSNIYSDRTYENSFENEEKIPGHNDRQANT